MSKSTLKVVVALGLLAFVLIFLGVNYVPRIFASSSNTSNSLDAAIQDRPDYTNEIYQRSIVPQSTYVGGDSIVHNLLSNTQQLSFAGADPLERILRINSPGLSYFGSDPLERILRTTSPGLSFFGSDPLERILRVNAP